MKNQREMSPGSQLWTVLLPSAFFHLVLLWETEAFKMEPQLVLPLNLSPYLHPPPWCHPVFDRGDTFLLPSKASVLLLRTPLPLAMTTHMVTAVISCPLTLSFPSISPSGHSHQQTEVLWYGLSLKQPPWLHNFSTASFSLSSSTTGLLDRAPCTWRLNLLVPILSETHSNWAFLSTISSPLLFLRVPVSDLRPHTIVHPPVLIYPPSQWLTHLTTTLGPYTSHLLSTSFHYVLL